LKGKCGLRRATRRAKGLGNWPAREGQLTNTGCLCSVGGREEGRTPFFQGGGAGDFSFRRKIRVGFGPWKLERAEIRQAVISKHGHKGEKKPPLFRESHGSNGDGKKAIIRSTFIGVWGEKTKTGGKRTKAKRD